MLAAVGVSEPRTRSLKLVMEWEGVCPAFRVRRRSSGCWMSSRASTLGLGEEILEGGEEMGLLFSLVMGREGAERGVVDGESDCGERTWATKDGARAVVLILMPSRLGLMAEMSTDGVSGMEASSVPAESVSADFKKGRKRMYWKC